MGLVGFGPRRKDYQLVVALNNSVFIYHSHLAYKHRVRAIVHIAPVVTNCATSLMCHPKTLSMSGTGGECNTL
jgi:hypothetical protein